MIYFIQASLSKLIKIGFSINPKKRIKNIKTLNSEEIKTLKIIDGDKHKEKELHNLFSKYRHHGEWFEPHQEILSFIEKSEVYTFKKEIIISINDIDVIKAKVIKRQNPMDFIWELERKVKRELKDMKKQEKKKHKINKKIYVEKQNNKKIKLNDSKMQKFLYKQRPFYFDNLSDDMKRKVIDFIIKESKKITYDKPLVFKVIYDKDEDYWRIFAYNHDLE